MSISHSIPSWIDEDNRVQRKWVSHCLSQVDHTPPQMITMSTEDPIQNMWHQRTITEQDWVKLQTDWEKALNQRSKKWLKGVIPDHREQCQYLVDYLVKKNVWPATGMHSRNPYHTLLDMVWNWDDSRKQLKKDMMHSWSSTKHRKGKKGLNVQISPQAHAQLKRIANHQHISAAECIERMIIRNYELEKHYEIQLKQAKKELGEAFERKVQRRQPLNTPARFDQKIEDIIKQINELRFRQPN